MPYLYIATVVAETRSSSVLVSVMTRKSVPGNCEVTVRNRQAGAVPPETAESGVSCAMR